MRSHVPTELRRILPIALLAVAATFASSALAGAETLAIDPSHSHVGFSIRHFFTQVKGEFKTVSGTLELDTTAPNGSKVSVEIDPASISTDNERRDTHLKSPDFFDVEKFPKLTFVATAVNITDPKAWTGTVTGDLTMHGVTKPVTLKIDGGGSQAMGPGGVMAGFTASGTLNRKDYGIIWNKVFDQGPAMLGDDVALEIDVEAHTPMQPKAPTAAATPAPAPPAAGASTH
jgi:polyisoprenoid-binding protein YceI